MRFTGVVIACALAGCVETGTVPCGDDLFCPEDRICVHATATVTVCAEPDSGECELLADGDLCGAAGRCYDHVCLPIACGDELVDPGAMGVAPREACDDGNVVSGDGCSADCRSDEQCGTGSVDPLGGETCDDGNLRAHDGCSYDCTIETPRWSLIVPGAPIRGEPSLVFDPVRGRVTMVGGSDTEIDAFEWSGLGWTQRDSQFTPQVRYGQAAAYDVARKNLVMFGGVSNGTNGFGDTWLLEDTGWTLVSLSMLGPGIRANHAMAYDPIRQRVVLFGGHDIGTVNQALGDTWEWDGATWTRVVVTGPSPSARYGHSMAFDPGRGKVILFGGQGAGGALDDTWEWNGTAWTVLAPQLRPAPRYGAAMATYRGGLLLYGGTLAGGAVDDSQWRWLGSTWSFLGPGAPGRRHAAGMATDFLRDRPVLFGGVSTTADVWEFDGSQFQKAGVLTPAPMQDAAAAFDSRRGRAIVVGDGATFERIDDSWVLLTATTPLPGSRPGVAYDSVRDELVMFGSDGAGPETWVLTSVGTNRVWVKRSPALSPGARNGQGLAYDAARSRAVIFGGVNQATPLGDTWEWDGTTWYDVTPAVRPPPREGHALAYDPIRRVTLLFGGFDGSTEVFGDTWEWNGTAWTLVALIGPHPIPRSGAVLTWNPNRQRLTMFGGDGGLLGRLDDAWEWDGTSWTSVPTQLRPRPRSRSVMMRTTDGAGLILFGGTTKLGPIDEVWRLRWEGTRIDEQCGGRVDRDGDGLAGCDDPDCWARCTPLCAPGMSCAADAPRCGDDTASSLESCQLCPADVTPCPTCGDQLCEALETHASCPGDCPL